MHLGESKPNSYYQVARLLIRRGKQHSLAFRKPNIDFKREMTMKRQTLLAALMFMSFICASAFSQNTKSKPFSLSLSASARQYKIGEPIDFTIIISNNTDKPLRMPLGPGDSMAEKFFGVVAVDAEGKVVAETPRGEIVHGKPDGLMSHDFGSSWLGTIVPGQGFRQHLSATRLYAFDRPGTYRVYVVRKSDDEPVVQISSNEIQIEITH
jgi:hypothetical protein